MTLVMKDGIDLFTIRRLSDELDCAVGGVYRYFPSKDALIAALQCRVLDELGAAFETCRTECAGRIATSALDETTGALLQLLEAGALYCERYGSTPETAYLIGRLIGDPRIVLSDAEAQSVIARAMPLFSALASLIEAAQSCGALDAGVSTDRAVTYYAALQGVLQLQKLSRLQPGLLDHEKLVREVSVTLLRGWGAEQQALDEAQKRLS